MDCLSKLVMLRIGPVTLPLTWLCSVVRLVCLANQPGYYSPTHPHPEVMNHWEGKLIGDVNRVLDTIERRQWQDAEERIDELSRNHFSHPATEVFQRFLLGRLQELRPVGVAPRKPSPSPTQPPAQSAEEAERRFVRALELIEEDDEAGAHGLLESTRGESPKDTELSRRLIGALKDLGLRRYSAGDPDVAIRCWRHVLELDPSDRESRRFLERAEKVQSQL